MKKLNNKGYMLVEIILASALAFGLAYFMLELTLKLKNKNDDLLVATMMATDKTIISNKIMERLKEKNYIQGCNSVYFDEILSKLSDNKITINFDDNNYDYVVNKYAKIGDIISECEKTDESTNNYDYNRLYIKIPLRNKSDINNDEYDIELNYYVHHEN